MSDYLFDGSGEPDAEIAHLEQLLAPLAYRISEPPVRRLTRRPSLWLGIGAALAAAALAIALVRPHPAPPATATRPSAWPLRGVAARTSLGIGEWLDTGGGSAQLTVPGLGGVVLAPHTRARIVARQVGAELELAHGALDAIIDAPARSFSVRTPRAQVIDLGCAFRVDVDASGRTHLVVTAGKVALADREGHEVDVPAGAASSVEDGRVGTPYAATASADFRALLLRYDRDPSVLPDLVRAAGPDDAVTLQFLASASTAVGEKMRELIRARLAVLATLPPHVAGAPDLAKRDAPTKSNATKPHAQKPDRPSTRPVIELDRFGKPTHDSFRGDDR